MSKKLTPAEHVERIRQITQDAADKVIAHLEGKPQRPRTPQFFPEPISYEESREVVNEAFKAAEMGPSMGVRLFEHELEEIGQFELQVPPKYAHVANRHWVYVKKGSPEGPVFAVGFKKREELLKYGHVTINALMHDSSDHE